MAFCAEKVLTKHFEQVLKQELLRFRDMNEKEMLRSEVTEMARQFALGSAVAVEMIQDGKLSFLVWLDAVAERSGSTASESTRRWIWVWDSLRKDAKLEKHLVELAPAGHVWNRFSNPILVLPGGSRFAIGLDYGEADSFLSTSPSHQLKARASVELVEDLYMVPGRNDRLQCERCRCLLEMTTDATYSRDRELDIMGIKEEQLIHVEQGLIVVSVGSINHAYTVASRRLEPERTSHGGNAYEHVVYLGPEENVQLEQIRTAVEIGAWNPNSSVGTPRPALPLFPNGRWSS